MVYKLLPYVPLGLLSHYLSTSLVVFHSFLFPPLVRIALLPVVSFPPSLLRARTVSLLFQILSINVSACPSSFLVTSFPRPISCLFWTSPVFSTASSSPPPVPSFHLFFSGTSTRTHTLSPG